MISDQDQLYLSESCMANLTSSMNFLNFEISYTSHLLSSMLNQPLPTSRRELVTLVHKVVSHVSFK